MRAITLFLARHARDSTARLQSGMKLTFELTEGVYSGDSCKPLGTVLSFTSAISVKLAVGECSATMLSLSLGTEGLREGAR